jgi:hypothetical protein
VIFDTGFTVGVGLTVMVNVFGLPEQVGPEVFLKLGVTVIVFKMGAVVLFTAVKDGIDPTPDTFGNPMTGVAEAAQLKVVPVTGVVKLIIPDAALLHKIKLAG